MHRKVSDQDGSTGSNACARVFDRQGTNWIKSIDDILFRPALRWIERTRNEIRTGTMPALLN